MAKKKKHFYVLYTKFIGGNEKTCATSIWLQNKGEAKILNLFTSKASANPYFKFENGKFAIKKRKIPKKSSAFLRVCFAKYSENNQKKKVLVFCTCVVLKARKKGKKVRLY